MRPTPCNRKRNGRSPRHAPWQGYLICRAPACDDRYGRCIPHVLHNPPPPTFPPYGDPGNGRIGVTCACQPWDNALELGPLPAATTCAPSVPSVARAVQGPCAGCARESVAERAATRWTPVSLLLPLVPEARGLGTAESRPRFPPPPPPQRPAQKPLAKCAKRGAEMHGQYATTRAPYRAHKTLHQRVPNRHRVWACAADAPWHHVQCARACRYQCTRGRTACSLSTAARKAPRREGLAASTCDAMRGRRLGDGARRPTAAGEVLAWRGHDAPRQAEPNLSAPGARPRGSRARAPPPRLQRPRR